MGLGVMVTQVVPQPVLPVGPQPRLAQLVLPWERQPFEVAQADLQPFEVAQAVVAQADLQPFVQPFPQEQALPLAAQGQWPIALQEDLCPRQLPLPESAQAVLQESTHPVLPASWQAVLQPVPQADWLVAQLVSWWENHFAPVLQPGNPANSSKAAEARAIHRLKAFIRNTPLNGSSRHSVQNGHVGAFRAKTGK
jgi:hypothetical protein